MLAADPIKAEEVLERARPFMGELRLALSDLRAGQDAWLPGFMAAV